MNKLEALNTLARAYKHIVVYDNNAANVIQELFHRVRRSMQSINQAICVDDGGVYFTKRVGNDTTEGLNGPMPKYF